MAEIKFDGYLPKQYDPLVISNINSQDASEVTKESFTNAPINMTFSPEYEKNSLQFKNCFSVETGDPADNPPEFVENLFAIVHGKSADWRLTGVYINTIGINLYYATDNPRIVKRHDKEYSTGMICLVLHRPMTLTFERVYFDKAPVQYKVDAHVNYIERVMTAQITKLIGGHEIYELEMREDNHGKKELIGQYCTGKLYL